MHSVTNASQGMRFINVYDERGNPSSYALARGETFTGRLVDPDSDVMIGLRDANELDVTDLGDDEDDATVKPAAGVKSTAKPPKPAASGAAPWGGAGTTGYNFKTTGDTFTLLKGNKEIKSGLKAEDKAAFEALSDADKDAFVEASS